MIVLIDLRASAVAWLASWARCNGLGRRGSTSGLMPPGLGGNLMSPGGGKAGPGPAGFGGGGKGEAGDGGSGAPGGDGGCGSKERDWPDQPLPNNRPKSPPFFWSPDVDAAADGLAAIFRVAAVSLTAMASRAVSLIATK